MNLRDSLYSSNNIDAIAQMQAAFDLKSKENEIDLLNNAQQLRDEQINKQKIIIFSLFGSALLFILLVFFIYRGYKKTKSINEALSHAYEQINEKNKSISDSIEYAKNIQNALLKIPEYFDRKLKDDYFILYKPKDVVSGDFYWVEQFDKKVLIAAADCTGHGVPGSLMSMLGIEKLKQAVREKGFTDPSEILSFANISFKETLSVRGTTITLRDGMDIALCCLNFPDNILQYAGANRPLLLVTTEGGQKILKEFKPTKAAIGGFTDDSQTFPSISYSPALGDVFYLFTDGFADQFGGLKDKKFNLKRFKELLLSISGLPMDEQHSKLNKAFEDWRSDNEQVDDVLVIGIRKS
jgi:serine phosphatase RsbU (regulator of sigma subunit)